ncbi:hypothetical protein [Paenibacillus chibensis]|uniref:hypothetical protein n=1 Tax=Paenibacillus chibensis TaxID=59846 RepID=UPI0013E406F3|nr:hypothetical protein [Paenibacillus chibensis]MEC0371586.1 hypothetical protein [Paenibacillus chibensis]
MTANSKRREDMLKFLGQAQNETELKKWYRIMEDIHADRVSGTKEDFQVLSKGLEYAISIFAERLRQEGFALLSKFAATEDKRFHQIMKSNLGKARIAKPYPEEISRIAGMMT